MFSILVLKYDEDINFEVSIAVSSNFNSYKCKTRLKGLIIFKNLYFYRFKRKDSLRLCILNFYQSHQQLC